jgi:ethanolamine utilization protein EutN
MQIATVIGNAVSTVKHPSMQGRKLMICLPRMADGVTTDGYPIVAVDGIGAGVGEKVIITSDGRGAREMLNVDATPVRWTIVGIQDPNTSQQ